MVHATGQQLMRRTDIWQGMLLLATCVRPAIDGTDSAMVTIDVIMMFALYLGYLYGVFVELKVGEAASRGRTSRPRVIVTRVANDRCSRA